MTASDQMDITKRMKAMMRAGHPMLFNRPKRLKSGAPPASWNIARLTGVRGEMCKLSENH